MLTWGAPVEEPLEPLCERFLRETVRYWQQLGEALRHPAALPGGGDSLGARAEAALLRGHRRDRRGDDDLDPRGAGHAAAPGTTATAGCATPTTRSARSACSATSKSASSSSTTCSTSPASAPELDLAPLYRIDGKTDLDEQILDRLAGLRRRAAGARGQRRRAAHAARRVRRDGAGADADVPRRALPRAGDAAGARSGRRGSRGARSPWPAQPDAGIWEFRTEWRPQTFSSLMCWAAADRMARIAQRAPTGAARTSSPSAGQRRSATRCLASARGPRARQPGGRLRRHRGRRGAAAGGDAAAAARRRSALHATVDAIRADLEHDGWLQRYRTDDGFGVPERGVHRCARSGWSRRWRGSAGRRRGARAARRACRDIKSPLGLLSEDVEPSTGAMWGNFPQAYSHVGLIHAAFAASPRWGEYGS